MALSNKSRLRFRRVLGCLHTVVLIRIESCLSLYRSLSPYRLLARVAISLAYLVFLSISLSLSLSPVVSHVTCSFSLARVRPLSFLSLLPFFSYYPPLSFPPIASFSHLRASAHCVVLLPSCRHTRCVRICFLPNLVKNSLAHSTLMHICNS